jgi:hypothetical protein
MTDARPPIAAFFDAFGVDAVVTPPGEWPIDTSVVWLTPNPVLEPSDGFSRREAQRLMAIRRSDVPAVPVGTMVLAPEMSGGSNVSWRVDGVDLVEPEHVRVFVVRV